MNLIAKLLIHNLATKSDPQQTLQPVRLLRSFNRRSNPAFIWSQTK